MSQRKPGQKRHTFWTTHKIGNTTDQCVSPAAAPKSFREKLIAVWRPIRLSGLSLYTIKGIYFINSGWKKNKGCSIKYSRNWNCLVWLVFDDSMQMTLLYSREHLNGNLSLANGNVAKPHWLDINYSMVTPTGEGESLQQTQVSPEFLDLMWLWRQNHDYQKHFCLVPQLFWKQTWGGSCHVFGVFVQV